MTGKRKQVGPPTIVIELPEHEAEVLKNFLYDSQHNLLRCSEEEKEQRQEEYDVIWKFIKLVEGEEF